MGEEEKKMNLKTLSKLVDDKFENSVNFHFEQLKALTPSDNVSKMILLGLGHSDPQEQQKVWNEMLCPSLDLTNQQKSQLQGKDLSKTFREMTNLMSELKSFQKRFKSVMRDAHNAVSDVSNSFSAVQHSKHEIWMQTNEDGFEALRCMWNK